MTLRQDLKDKEFVITAELNPPRGSDASTMIANAGKLKGLVSAVNLTDNSAATSKMCPLVASHLIKSRAGVDAILQLTCRDRNRLAIQSDLYGAANLGLQNLLVLRGDPPNSPIAEEKCFDLGTEDLIQLVAKLKQGKDAEGKDLKGEVDFCMAAAAHPGLPDLTAQKETMLRRLDLGVEFFQTQICFETEQIDRFVESIGDELASKVILGITPLKTLGQAEFMNKNIFGVTVPDSHLAKMQEALADQDPKLEAAKKAQQEQGQELAAELVAHIKNTPLKGIHLMAIGQESRLDEIIKAIS